jgi:hypothetical protein
MYRKKPFPELSSQNGSNSKSIGAQVVDTPRYSIGLKHKQT